MSNYGQNAAPMQSYDGMYAEFTTPARESLTARREFLHNYIDSVERDLTIAQQRLRMARHELDVTAKALENLAAGFDNAPAEINRLPPLVKHVRPGDYVESRAATGTVADSLKSRGF